MLMERLEDQECVRDAEVEKYRVKIVGMINDIEEIKFLNQVRTILKRHIEKRGG